MGKRGQITTFVVIGLVLIAVIGVFIYTRQMQVQQATTTAGREVVSADVRPLQIFVEQCIQKTAVPGIYLLGEQGGYINPPANSYDSDIFTIGYGFSGNSTTLPTIEAMQAEISDYLKEFIPLCTAGFEDFKKEWGDFSLADVLEPGSILEIKTVLTGGKGPEDFIAKVQIIRVVYSAEAAVQGGERSVLVGAIFLPMNAENRKLLTAFFETSFGKP